MTLPLTQAAQLLTSNARPLSVLTSSVLALTSFYYVYTIGSYFKVIVQILQDRIVYLTFFQDFVISRYIDHAFISVSALMWLLLSLRGVVRLILAAGYGSVVVVALSSTSQEILEITALLSLPVILSILVADKLGYRVINVPSILFARYLVILGIIIGTLSIFLSSAIIISSLDLQSIPDFSYEIYSLLSSSSPALMFLLIFCVPVKFLFNEIIYQKLRPILKAYNPKFDGSTDQFIRRRTIIAGLISFVGLSAIMVLIPHQPTINEDGQDVGVDTHYYVDWIGNLTKSNNPQDLLRQLFTIQDGDRPLSLLFLYAMVTALNASPSFTLEIVVPILFSASLILITYFLALEITGKNQTVAIIAAFLTSISFQTLIGIYAGFYANWFAIIIGYSSFFFLFRYLKTSKRVDLFACFILLVALLFAHVYTWTIIVAVSAIFLLVSLKLSYYHKKNVSLLLLVLACTVAIDLVKAVTTGATVGLWQDVHVASSLGGSLQENLLTRWDNIVLTQAKYAGLLGNFIILALGVYWTIKCDWREKSSIFLFVFLSIGIAPLFLGNWLIQSRTLYDIPFQLPAAIALTQIRRDTLGSMMLVVVAVWLVAIALKSVSNFYLIRPS